MKRYLILVLIPLFFSCKEEKPEVIDINDVIPKAERDYDSVEEIVEEAADSIVFKMNEFKTANIQLDSLQFVTKKQFPDRFGAISTEKYHLFNENSSVVFQKWSYADSAKTMNAFYNWMDCFGKKCDSYKIGEEVKIGSVPKLIAVGDTTILMVEGNKIDIAEWEDFLEQKGFENWHYWIEQKPYRKSEWFEIKDEKINLKDGKDETNG